MNRRKFLRSAGISATAVLITPGIAIEAAFSDIVDPLPFLDAEKVLRYYMLYGVLLYSEKEGLLNPVTLNPEL